MSHDIGCFMVYFVRIIGSKQGCFNSFLSWSNHLQPAIAFLRNLDNDLSPSPPPSQRHQRILDPIQPDKLLIRILCALNLALFDQPHNSLPHLGNHLPLMNRIRAPVNAHQRDILQQHLVHGHLFNSARSEAHNQDAAVPGGAFGGLVDEADGVVDDVDAAGLWR